VDKFRKFRFPKGSFIYVFVPNPFILTFTLSTFTAGNTEQRNFKEPLRFHDESKKYKTSSLFVCFVSPFLWTNLPDLLILLLV